GRTGLQVEDRDRQLVQSVDERLGTVEREENPVVGAPVAEPGGEDRGAVDVLRAEGRVLAFAEATSYQGDGRGQLGRRGEARLDRQAAAENGVEVDRIAGERREEDDEV